MGNLKASTRIKRANDYLNRADNLLAPISEKISETLDDQSAHVFCQAGDGWVIAYNGGLYNAAIDNLGVSIDDFLLMDKTQMLELLNEAGI